MCLQLKSTAVLPGSAQPCPHRPVAVELPPMGPPSKPLKRRRSLWELSASAACPVLGVCLPLCEQRSLMRKCGIDVHGRSDYELHQIGVSECRRRTELAERLQKWLDAEFAADLRRAAACSGTEALRQLWQQARSAPGWGGIMWALLTHPDCLLNLEHELLGEVHMMQHQVGVVARVEQSALAQLRSRCEALHAELAQTRLQAQEQQRQAQQRLSEKQAELQQARLGLVRAQEELARLSERYEQLRAERPQAEQVQTLLAENAALREQCQQAQRALRASARAGGTADDAPQTGLGASAAVASNSADPATSLARADEAAVPAALAQRIACVGGRTAQVSGYREVVEAHGAELLHHDGGEEHNLSQLPATLAAADWVICQVGCISHNAYWRVKEHCKRTGKPCLYLENSSRSALERAMQRISAAAQQATQD